MEGSGEDAVSLAVPTIGPWPTDSIEWGAAGSQGMPLIPIVVGQNMDLCVIRLGKLGDEALKRLSSQHEGISKSEQRLYKHSLIHLSVPAILC